MLTVHGINGTTATLSAADLARLPQQTVKTTDHGKPVTFQGVLLTDVLSRVSLPTGEKFHHTAAAYYLTVEAKDGYDVHGQGRLRGDENEMASRFRTRDAAIQQPLFPVS
jgi:hypothetical protein